MPFVIEPKPYMMKTVEVIYLPIHGRLFQQEIPFVAGMTVQQAIEQSAFYTRFPEVTELSVGIFSKKVTLNTGIKPGDRVEIYRPLQCNPKERRRKKAVLTHTKPHA